MDVASLLERANARAATLFNLKKSYGGSNSASTNKAKYSSSTGGSQANSISGANVASTSIITASSSCDKKQQQQPILARTRGKGALDMLLSIVNSDDARTRRFFSEQIDGKSIVLANTSKQVRAASASSRGKAHLRRQKRATDASLLKAEILDPYAVPGAADVHITYNLWLNFVWGVIDSCSSEAQLQARLYSAGLLGAKVSVRRTRSQHLRQGKGKRGGSGSGEHELTGYVCSEGKNCLYIAVGCDDDADRDDMADDPSPPPKRKRTSETAASSNASTSSAANASPALSTVQVHRVLRVYSEILVHLPDKSGGGSQMDRVCVFRGSAYSD